MKPVKTGVVVFALLFGNIDMIHAQYDSAYYVSYAHRLTTRFYFSQKYTSLTIRNKRDHYTLNYLPNTTLNMGVGASYKWASLNIAIGWKFLNPDDSHGTTKYLDLQFHGYGQKFTLDLFGQFYTGFYLYPKGVVIPNELYIRPDMKVSGLGGSFQYILNHRRFSLRSSSLQTAWQKKSAGTFLVGMEVYGGSIRSDSSLVPATINKSVSELNETRTAFFMFGPSAGYAYTLVVARNFFFTASGSASLDFGFSSITNLQGEYKRYGLISNASFRAIVGYNSTLWAFSVVYVNNGIRIPGATDTNESTLNIGNLRANLVHRFSPNKKQKKILEEIIK